MMNSLIMVIALFIFIDVAYGLVLYKNKDIYFDRVSDGNKSVLRVDGLIAIVTLYLFSMEFSCVLTGIASMRV